MLRCKYWIWLPFATCLFLCPAASAASSRAGPTISSDFKPPNFAGLPPDLPNLTTQSISVPGDELWADDFGTPLVDGSLWCAVRFGGDLIVGGYFRQIGGVSVHNVARWDGSAWHPLGAGVDRGVRCLTVYKDRLYAGGQLECSEGMATPQLAEWDGVEWSPIIVSVGGNSCNYELTSLTVFQDELIAGGAYGFPDYWSPTPPPVNGLARWDGSTWRSLGSGVNGRVEAMLAVGDSLYVAGSFDSAGGLPAANVAVWAGGSWSPMGSGVDGPATSLVSYQGRVVACGGFSNSGTTPVHNLAAWNGDEWLPLGEFEANGGNTLAVFNGVLAIGGYPSIGLWDGSTWTPEIGGIEAENIQGLLSDATGLIAFGLLQIQGAGQSRGFSIARWDGNSWSSYEPWNGRMKGLANYYYGSSPAWLGCLASFQGDLIVGGRVNYAGNGSSWVEVSPVSRWNGLSWKGMPFPQSISGTPEAFLGETDTLYAAGSFFDSTTPPDTLNPYHSNPVLKWTSNAWTPMGDLRQTTGMCLARYDGVLMLGTRDAYSGENGVYAWDGAHWNPIGIAAGHEPGVGVYSLLVHDGRLIAGGAFTSMGGTPARGVAAWDGVSWQALGDGPPGYANPWVMYLRGMASYKGRLIAAGQFIDASRTRPLYEWNGTEWAAMEGITGFATAICVAKGKLFIAGGLAIGPEGVGARVATWDGVSWTALGSGVNDEVTAILEHDAALYVGGYFSTAGSKSSFGIARWDGFHLAQSRPLSLSGGRPNPFLTTTDLSFRLEEPRRVRIVVHDVRGREVVVLEDGVRGAGPHAIHWNGMDRLGKVVPAGVYFISVRGEAGQVASRKVVRLR